MTEFQRIRKAIEHELQFGKEEPLFVICPFGDLGLKTKQVLNECFGLQEYLILDNLLCKTNKNIMPLEYLAEIDTSKIRVLFTVENPEVRDEVKKNLLEFVDKRNIVEVFPGEIKILPKTRCGKHSYGPLCNHWLVEEVGAFCSFAIGADVVGNHPIEYISTSPFMYRDESVNAVFGKWDEYKNDVAYVEGIKPKAKVERLRRIKIGNDVWLGRNVLITNGVNIGNGVIAGAGAVITKDVPDYAVVVGVPAKVMRYRYTPEQIEKLNEIAWWNWSDEKIRECYDDFFLDVDEFIKKHQK